MTTRRLPALLALFTTLAFAAPAFAETPEPKADVKKVEAKKAEEAKPAAKKIERRINKKDGKKTVKLSTEGAKEANVDLGDSQISARPQNPIVQVELERAPIKFEVHELRGPYGN